MIYISYFKPSFVERNKYEHSLKCFLNLIQNDYFCHLGYDAQNTSFAPVTSSDNDVPHSSIHTKPSSSSCSFQLRGINRKTYKYKNKILIETHRTANLLH